MCTVVIMPCCLAPCDHRRIFERRLEGAEAGLRKPHALARKFGEIVLCQTRLQDHRAGADPHAARPVVLEALWRRRASALTPSGSFGRPGTCTSEAEIDVVVPPCT